MCKVSQVSRQAARGRAGQHAGESETGMIGASVIGTTKPLVYRVCEQPPGEPIRFGAPVSEEPPERRSEPSRLRRERTSSADSTPPGLRRAREKWVPDRKPPASARS